MQEGSKCPQRGALSSALVLVFSTAATEAVALGRNYRRVYEDVEALEAAGLLDRDKQGLRAEYDSLDVAMKVAL
jgi:hypothetical protein